MATPAIAIARMATMVIAIARMAIMGIGDTDIMAPGLIAGTGLAVQFAADTGQGVHLVAGSSEGRSGRARGVLLGNSSRRHKYSTHRSAELDKIVHEVLSCQGWRRVEYCSHLCVMPQCDRSCESCLQHYHYQYLKERLDRKLGTELLRYGLSGEAPAEKHRSRVKLKSSPAFGAFSRWTVLLGG